MEEYGINYKNTLDRYEGEYKDGYYDRIGIYNYGKRYKGEFKQNKYSGLGTFYYNSVSRYILIMTRKKDLEYIIIMMAQYLKEIIIIEKKIWNKLL